MLPNEDELQLSPPPRSATNRRQVSIVVGLVVFLIMIGLGIGIRLYNQNQYPDVTGNYSGTCQCNFGGSGSISLNINQENGASIGGIFTLENSRFIVNNGTVDHSGNIQFSINVLSNTIIFIGTAQSSGGWQGTFGDAMNQSGTWGLYRSR